MVRSAASCVARSVLAAIWPEACLMWPAAFLISCRSAWAVRLSVSEAMSLQRLLRGFDPYWYSRANLVFTGKKAADGGAGQQMALGLRQELVTGQARRQVGLQIGRHHRDQIMVRPIALRRAGADIIRILAGTGAAGKADAFGAVAFLQFGCGGRDIVGDPMRHTGAELAVNVVHQDGEAFGARRRIVPGELRRDILAGAGADGGIARAAGALLVIAAEAHRNARAVLDGGGRQGHPARGRTVMATVAASPIAAALSVRISNLPRFESI